MAQETQSPFRTRLTCSSLRWVRRKVCSKSRASATTFSFSATEAESFMRSVSSFARKAKIPKKANCKKMIKGIPAVLAQKEISLVFPVGVEGGRSSIRLAAEDAGEG